MLVITQQGYDQIQAHTLKALPQECCGLIIGRIDENECYLVHSLMPSKNVADGDKTTRFEIDPKVRFDLLRKERQGELGENKVIGFYHSHPFGAAWPSQTDRSMVYEPELLWVIATQDEIKAFSYEESKQDFFEVCIQLKQ